MSVEAGDGYTALVDAGALAERPSQATLPFVHRGSRAGAVQCARAVAFPPAC